MPCQTCDKQDMSNLAFSVPLAALRPFRNTVALTSHSSSSRSQFISAYAPVFITLPGTAFPRRRPRCETVSADARDASAETDKETADQGANTASAVLDFRNIRKALVFLSLLGAGETSYLTFNKLFSSPGAICGTQGCLDVLSGPFSSFLGVPLTLLGALAYAIVAYLAVWPLAADEEEGEDGTVRSVEEVYAARDAVTRPLLLALSTVVSTLIFTLTAFVGRAVPKWADALRVGVVSSATACVAAAVLFFIGYPTHIRAQPGEPQSPPVITMRSTSDTVRLAGKLSKQNTKMYGAYWCSHCYDQKQRFGKNAFSKIQYIECDKHGVNSKYQLCRDKRIPGYPTWEIGGELYPGEIDLPELERLVDESAK